MANVFCHMNFPLIHDFFCLMTFEGLPHEFLLASWLFQAATWISACLMTFEGLPHEFFIVSWLLQVCHMNFCLSHDFSRLPHEYLLVSWLSDRFIPFLELFKAFIAKFLYDFQRESVTKSNLELATITVILITAITTFPGLISPGKQVVWVTRHQG